MVLLALAVGLAFLALDRLRTWDFGDLLQNLGEIARLSNGSGRELLHALTHRQVAETVELAESLQRDGLYASTTQESAPLFDTLFAIGGAPYRGTDRHSPSDYFEAYGWFLEQHGRSLADRPLSSGADLRILTVSPQQLRQDFFEDSSSYLAFREWHKKNGVSLLWVDPGQASELAAQFGLGDADVGLWPRFALLFYPRKDGGVTLGIRFPGQTDHEPSYRAVKEYIGRLEAAAQPVDDPDSGIELFGAELASAWGAYVDVHARMDPRGRVARMLDSELQGRTYILDAAAGMGCESVYLLKRGFSVESNEIDPFLALEAEQLAQRHGMSLRLSHHLWETMYATMSGNFKFDATLVLGNALSLVTNAEHRRACIRSFRDVLAPHGILVIDERNYPQILAQREHILKNPLKAFGPATKGDVMFQGDQIRGYPAAISPDLIVWDFFLNGPALRGEDLSRRRLGGPLLELYPFKRGELLSLLVETGFYRIKVYADLELVAEDINEVPNDPRVTGADFLTYVAEKPLD
ncbi:MAG TPA: hypothetical protein VLJ80_07400 [Solirubrobacteraceae bacterium]|nr:hypothetical protein [Solirubrobacteraceae bacterium]